MPESEYSQENLAYIRTDIEQLRQLVRFEISTNPNCRAEVERRLAERAGMPEVYLALESGPKTQDELAAALGWSQPTISRVCKELYGAGLVGKVPTAANRRVMAYAWIDLEQLLGISRLARAVIARTSVKGGAAKGAAAIDGARPIKQRAAASKVGSDNAEDGRDGRDSTP